MTSNTILCIIRVLSFREISLRGVRWSLNLDRLVGKTVIGKSRKFLKTCLSMTALGKEKSSRLAVMIGYPVLRRFLLLLLVLQETFGCPNHQHDFREEGFGVATISVHSSVKWVTVDKSRLLGITVSSGKDQGAVEISKRLLIKSAVTVCSKCRMATGMVFMTLDQLRQIAALRPALEPLLSKAIATQHQ